MPPARTPCTSSMDSPWQCSSFTEPRTSTHNYMVGWGLAAQYGTSFRSKLMRPLTSRGAQGCFSDAQEMMGHPPGASLHEGSEQSLHGLLPRFLLQGGVGRGDHRIEAMIPKVNELASNKVVVVADPISTGCCDLRGFQCGYKVIRGWSVEASPEMRTHAPQSCESIVYLATLVQGSTLEATGVAVKKAVDNLQLSAVTVGGESGVPVQMHCQSSSGFAPMAHRSRRGQQETAAGVGQRGWVALCPAGRRHSAGRHPGLPAFGADAQCRQARGVGRARSM